MDPMGTKKLETIKYTIVKNGISYDIKIMPHLDPDNKKYNSMVSVEGIDFCFTSYFPELEQSIGSARKEADEIIANHQKSIVRS